MTCYYPLKGYRGRGGQIVFNVSQSISGSAIDVNCGQCVGCRLARAGNWAVRCMHEASLYEDNCWVTLTYANEWLPEGDTLVLKDLQDFMKRLRKKFEPRKIRFYASGEYGEINERPHYHVCLFNLNFADRYIWRKSASGELQYKSDTLDALWRFGDAGIGALTYESAAYTAKYVVDKLTGEAACKYQPHVDLCTGQVYGEREAPFNVMSRRPGIGHDWLVQFSPDVYPEDFVVSHSGKKLPVPRYYDDLLKRREGEDVLVPVKKRRKARRRKSAKDYTPDRLKVRGEVALANLKRFSRDVE